MAQTWYDEYFPMTTSIVKGLSGYGNKLQNAILSSGVNTNKTGWNSGRKSYTPNTAPVTGLNPKAPIVQPQVSTPGSTPTLASKPEVPRNTTGKNIPVSSKGLQPPPALVPTTAAIAGGATTIPVVSSVPSTGLSDTQLFNNGKVYTGVGNTMSVNSAPIGLSMDQLVSQYSPEELGKMDFSGYGAGTLGTDPTEQYTGLSGYLSNKDLMSGLSMGAGALQGLYGMYNDYQANKRAEDALNMYKQDRAAQYKANADWNRNIAASGLGTASRPTLGR